MERENTNQKLFTDSESLFTQIMSIEDLGQNLTRASKDNKITLFCHKITQENLLTLRLHFFLIQNDE